MTSKALLHAAVTVQAAGLVGENLRVLRKKKKKAKDFLGLATTNLVGTALLKEQSDLVESF